VKTCKHCGKRVRVTVVEVKKWLRYLHDWAVQRRFKQERGW
jgi:hypothetical protein